MYFSIVIDFFLVYVNKTMSSHIIVSFLIT